MYEPAFVETLLSELRNDAVHVVMNSVVATATPVNVRQIRWMKYFLTLLSMHSLM